MGDEHKRDEHKPEESAEPGLVSGSGITTDLIGEQHVHPEPVTSSEGVRTYTVEAGDTLASISERFYGDPKQSKRIMDANRDRLADGLREGDLLLIPPVE